MTSAAAFLGGANTRLLPAAIPLRFFGAAIVFHVLGWLALLASAPQWIEFRGGLGWPLAALHLFTLGVLAMTAMGAGAQLMPVATRQPAMGPRWLSWIWWTYTPGVAVLALGMGLAQPSLLAVGAVSVVVPLAAWAVLMLRHLAGAHGMPGLRLHAWASLVCLGVLLATALALVSMWAGLPLADRGGLLSLHLVAGPFGFMGLLVLGLSYVLVPMFALANEPSPKLQKASGVLAVAALVLAAFGLVLPAVASAAVAFGIHVYLMAEALRTGMRKGLGRSMLLVKTGWASLAACLLASALDLPAPVFGVLLVGGWLLGTLFGMLQRILPFLGSMHAPPGKRRAPTPSSLSHEPSLRVHFACHLLALAGLLLALAFGNAVAAALAAAIGVAGAAAFAAFYVHLLRKIAP
ncbi:MAG: hypothetical protein HY854_05230 [Burkholderiales bacterium]|nr:hypothetical protein [Burkholderiales bacterium]